MQASINLCQIPTWANINLNFQGLSEVEGGGGVIAVGFDSLINMYTLRLESII